MSCATPEPAAPRRRRRCRPRRSTNPASPGACASPTAPRRSSTTSPAATTHDIAATTGDFLVATKEGLPSYQLAVVVDDARQRIDRIVRGDDLLGSTHRQLLLQQRLGIAPPPEYYHLPLVVGADGRRLAKRHGDSRISHYRELGVTPERIIGLLAEWCGLGPRREQTAAEFLASVRSRQTARKRRSSSPPKTTPGSRIIALATKN